MPLNERLPTPPARRKTVSYMKPPAAMATTRQKSGNSTKGSRGAQATKLKTKSGTGVVNAGEQLGAKKIVLSESEDSDTEEQDNENGDLQGNSNENGKTSIASALIRLTMSPLDQLNDPDNEDEGAADLSDEDDELILSPSQGRHYKSMRNGGAVSTFIKYLQI